MSRKIFKNIMLVSMIVLIATIALIMGVLYNYYSEQYTSSLMNEAASLREAIDIGGTDYLDTICSEHRITIIEADGTVDYDSVSDPVQMGNHSDREEFREAIKDGSGVAERYSSTLSEKTVNAAVLLDNGKVLRVSATQFTVIMLLMNVALPMLLIIVVAMLLSLFLAFRVSKSITEPINQINLESPDESKVYEELTPLVNKITAQNEQIAKQMQDIQTEHDNQDNMRREFTANVSHELKTPLTSISGYAEIIRNGIAKPEDIPRFAGKIYEESQRLITLVGDIIKLSQLDGKEVAVKMEDIDLYDTCQSVIYHLEKTAQDNDIKLSLSGEHLHINGATQIVEEMIFNLCDNAIKYNKPGGMVNVNLCQCVDGKELSVSDTGIGIPKEDIDHIFERFYRVDKSHSKEIGGTGLGLSIVKHGAMFMNAKLGVESAENQGTTFRILF